MTQIGTVHPLDLAASATATAQHTQALTFLVAYLALLAALLFLWWINKRIIWASYDYLLGRREERENVRRIARRRHDRMKDEQQL